MAREERRHTMNDFNRRLSMDIWLLFNQARQLLVTIRNKELNELGVSMSATAVLRTVKKFGENATLKGLSDELHFARHSVRELVIRMEKDGLLKRNKNRKKRNTTYVKITDKGREISERADAEGSIDYIFSALTDEEKKELQDILTTIRKNSIKFLKGNIKDLYPPIDPDLQRVRNENIPLNED
jgi:DNA-binding MarR family transcriptional regulator